MSESTTDPDFAALESRLSEHLDAPVTGTEVLNDGLNLVVKVSTAEAEDAYVVRKPNEMRDTDLFNDARQEFEILRRLQDTAVPTSEPVLFCDDESILGRPFSVLSYVEGEGIPWDGDLPERFRSPESRRLVGERLVDALADVHTVDVVPFEPVCDRITRERSVESPIERFDRAASVTGHDAPVLREVADRLRANVPENPATTLIHGDYKPDNVFFAGTDSPELTAVVDWETAALGDPLTELGYLLFFWRDQGDPTPSLDGLEADADDEAIRDLRERNENGFWPFTSAPGSPTRRELVNRYEERTGFAFENERFYRARGAFVLAAVWEDLYRIEVESGEAVRGDPEWELHVEYVGRIAKEILDGELPL